MRGQKTKCGNHAQILKPGRAAFRDKVINIAFIIIASVVFLLMIIAALLQGVDIETKH